MLLTTFNLTRSYSYLICYICIFNHKVTVYATAERADTLPVFNLFSYMYSVCRAVFVSNMYVYLGTGRRGTKLHVAESRYF